jgi:hypothetical protein
VFVGCVAFFAEPVPTQKPVLLVDFFLAQRSPTGQSCPFSQVILTGAELVGADDIMVMASAARTAIRNEWVMGRLPRTCATIFATPPKQ